jgi:hypothetical protein
MHILGEIGFLLFEFLAFFTGEIILYIVSFGNRKPRWNMYEDEPPHRWAVLTELSAWIGMVFWIAVGFLLHRMVYG